MEIDEIWRELCEKAIGHPELYWYVDKGGGNFAATGDFIIGKSAEYLYVVKPTMLEAVTALRDRVNAVQAARVA